MDERSCRIMSMFFKGPCEGHAIVVEENDATVAIVDTRFEHARQVLEQTLAQGKMDAIIVLSSQTTDRIIHDKIMYLDKPISTNPMFEALDWAKDLTEGKQRQKPFQTPRSPIRTAKAEPVPSAQELKANEEEAIIIADQVIEQHTEQTVEQPVELETENTDLPEQSHHINSVTTTAIENKAHASMQVEERDFSDVIGTVLDIDLNDPAKQRAAFYDPSKYYQGCVQDAFNKARTEDTALQLTLGWNPLIILPHSKQIWWDADDKLLKAVSDIEINVKTATITPLSPNALAESVANPEKKQDMDAFLWKLTLWSSRGRYPLAIDIDSPIQLKKWPNFTRYIVTPHALRIAALLIKEGPDTMIGIANTLNIELRYVSIFVSATHALGLIRQLPPLKIDEVLSPTARPKTAPQKRSLLNKILNKLLGR